MQKLKKLMKGGVIVGGAVFIVAVLKAAWERCSADYYGYDDEDFDQHCGDCCENKATSESGNKKDRCYVEQTPRNGETKSVPKCNGNDDMLKALVDAGIIDLHNDAMINYALDQTIASLDALQKLIDNRQNRLLENAGITMGNMLETILSLASKTPIKDDGNGQAEDVSPETEHANNKAEDTKNESPEAEGGDGYGEDGNHE